MKILIICKANSCRSQMAEAFLQKTGPGLIVVSAGTEPAEKVHPLTISAMAEIGFDISGAITNDIRLFIHEDWDYVITVCDIARESCPAFVGKVKHSIYLKFEDPLAYPEDDAFLMKLISSTRDHIEREIEDFYIEFITKKQQQ